MRCASGLGSGRALAVPTSAFPACAAATACLHCRDLPRLIDIVQGGVDGAGAGADGSASGRGGRAAAMNVQLSADETYADIVPVRQPDARSAFVSIMRGCNNMVRPWATAAELDAQSVTRIGQRAWQGILPLAACSHSVHCAPAGLHPLSCQCEPPPTHPPTPTPPLTPHTHAPHTPHSPHPSPGAPPAVLLLHRTLHPRPGAQPTPAVNRRRGAPAGAQPLGPGPPSFPRRCTRPFA